MISAISWVPKGASKPVPEVADPPSKEEIEEAIQSVVLQRCDNEDEDDEDVGDGNMEVEAAEQEDEVPHARAAADALGRPSKNTNSGEAFGDIADSLRELDMDNYDEEDDGVELFGTVIANLYYPSNDMDPYLKDRDDDEDSEELEDKVIQPMDSVIVCARNEDDVSDIVVYIYEELADGVANQYSHHEILIPAYPLCTAWLDCPLKGGEKGNFIAVGSMEPFIEIWDLDTVNEVQPVLVLGGIAEKKKNKKGKKTSVKYKKDSHTDSVLGLSWNKEFRNLLASASADNLVKIWDVATGECKITMKHHTDKVQAVAWNHHKPQVLLSGSFDRSVVMRDGSDPSLSGFKWSLPADVESLAWDLHTEHSFVVSLEDGTVKGFDIRAASSDSSSESKSSFTLHAHDQAVCSVSYNFSAPNLLATGSTDKMVKLWDLSNNQPSCIASTNHKVGAVFSVAFSEDSPFLLAVGGSKGNLVVWNTLDESGVSRKFGKYRNQDKSQPEA